MPVPGKLPAFLQIQFDAYEAAKERANFVVERVSDVESILRFKRRLTEFLKIRY